MFKSTIGIRRQKNLEKNLKPLNYVACHRIIEVFWELRVKWKKSYVPFSCHFFCLTGFFFGRCYCICSHKSTLVANLLKLKLNKLNKIT